MKVGLLLTLLGTVLWAGDASASLYKCQNADGTVRYQETPCNAGMRGTRLETRSPSNGRHTVSKSAATWADVRRAKAHCDEVARRNYAENDSGRNRYRISCMERVEKACGKDRASSRCRSEVRRASRRVETTRKRTRRTPGDPELLDAKASCHAWSSAEPSHSARNYRGEACRTLADSCRADRHGADCRERILQFQRR